MKDKRNPRRRQKNGYALTVALLFLGIMLVYLTSAMQWTSNSTSLTMRNNLYNSSVYAAEAATEQVLSKMEYDFINQNLSTGLSNYCALIPVQTNWPLRFRFTNGQGVPNQTSVQNLGLQVQTNVNSEFAGLYGLISSYQVTATAQPTNALFRPLATVNQQFQLALIPVFQFAIFYNLDLEINPGAPMIITGKVHGNGPIYSAPGAALEYKDYVTSVGQMFYNRSPNDPQTGTKVPPTFDKGYDEKVGSLTLPTGGSDNNPTNAVRFLDPPPLGESPSSQMGRERLFNNALLIISNSPTGVISVKAGSWDSFANVLPEGTNAVTGKPTYSWVTNTTFYDYREKKTVQATQIDVGAFNTWLAKSGATGGSALNNLAQASLNHGLNSVYVMNQQQSATTLAATRVVNGAALPGSGLTVATPRPLYVKGNFNLNNGDATPGLTNTVLTKPASLIGDSVTILSPAWSDAYDASTLVASRIPGNMTVNAAILTGIVESTTDASGVKHYSGGVENLPRMLENWGGKTLTYNGSMVVMFPSRYATNYWPGTGLVYNPPTRKWAFDMNFLTPNRLPPLAPSVRKLVREQWQTIAGY